MTVERINKEARLAAAAALLVDRLPPAPSPLTTLNAVRAQLWAKEATKWAFVAEDAPGLKGTPPVLPGVLGVLAASTLLLWPFLLVALAALALLWALSGLGAGIWAAIVVFVAQLVAIYWWLRRKEQTDIPEDVAPQSAKVEEFMKRENFAAQNHLAAASTMKPGPFRMFTLRVGLWAAGQDGARFSRPSFLGPSGVIHFARWLILPGTDKLLFYSNYDGAWESYLENFIEEAYKGVTGIWSNTLGFPRTDNLFGIGKNRGANDGDRLRRWTRRQQYLSLVWYSGYPRLTTDRIRTNAAIRQGIALAQTESDAADWLACFGSEPRPAAILEAAGDPHLGLRRLVAAALRRIPHASADRRRRHQQGLAWRHRATANVRRRLECERGDACGLLGVGTRQTWPAWQRSSHLPCRFPAGQRRPLAGTRDRRYRQQ